ncbi:EpsG family protein [Shewanella sp. S1-49-MNA-CIBAN-0167]|uniref:EpsG family protein n=1 Tax=Shewanella sp. S1-49-MNA-CIBAN-0167 TaxID=3140468 RepID=UPI0033241A59
MELSFLLYFTLFVVLSCWQYIDFKLRKDTKVCSSLFIMIKTYPIVFFIIIVGFRYNVGGDFPTYEEYYVDQFFVSDSSQVAYEFGFYTLIEILHFFSLPSQSLFVICSIFQVVLLLKIVQIAKGSGLLLIFFYFTTLSFIESLNVMRQSIALLGVILALYYLANKKYKYSILNTMVAVIFHSSSLLAIPLMFLLYKSSLYKYRYTIILFTLLSHFFAVQFFSFFVDMVLELPIFGGYSGYLAFSKDLFIENVNDGISIGLILSLLTDVYLIIRGTKFIAMNSRSLPSVVFNSYLIGCLIYPIVASTGFLALGRGMMYFYGMKFVVMSAVLYAGFKSGSILERKGVILTPIVLLYLLWFCMAVYIGAAGSSPYQSYWG